MPAGVRVLAADSQSNFSQQGIGSKLFQVIPPGENTNKLISIREIALWLHRAEDEGNFADLRIVKP